MIVDDEPANTVLLEKLFAMVGIGVTSSINDPRLAVSHFGEFLPDLILLDLTMPYRNGFEVLADLQKLIPPGDYLPILVLTADATDQVKQRALSSGANDFVTKPFNSAEVVLRVRNLLETRRLHLEMRRGNENLESVVAHRTSELRQALEELRNTQQQVIQQERLRALGTMASGVVHDFNNSLSIILGFTDFALVECRRQPSMAKASEQLEIVRTTAQDAAKIVGRLRSFYCTEKSPSVRPVDLGAVVEQAVTITEPRWKSQAMAQGVDIAVELKLEKTPALWGHAHELREVLTNLIFNAVDAMPDGGTLTFRTGVENDSSFVSITDTGTGMCAETRQRCLEPFFTTKGEGGSGLGLAMVYGIIQRHQGQLDIRSEEGKGTTFFIWFPTLEAPAETATDELQETMAQSLDILIVDDQEEIREIIAAQVGELHNVTTAADGEEAVEKLRAAHFDLVITDQAMPGMNGEQLASVVKAMHPDTRVILLTGFGTSYERSGNAENIDLILGKPILQSDFRSGIARVMSGEGREHTPIPETEMAALA